MEKIINRTKEYEGFSLKPYQCTAGKWTIGYGYNYQDRGFSVENMTEILSNGFSAGLADRLIAADVARCVAEAEKNFGFYKNLNDARQGVVIDMLYQLGLKGLSGFKNFLKALTAGDYAKAAAEMTDSRWYTQSGRRSRTNVKQMQSGQWEAIA